VLHPSLPNGRAGWIPLDAVELLRERWHIVVDRSDRHLRVVRDGKLVASLGAGEFFGELSVLDRLPRNASVISDSATACLALASWDFEKVLLDQPQLTLHILRGVATRLREVTESTRH
jgi:CRP-like cAMP-binding protein